MHQVTTILAISKDVLFPGHNQLLTTSTALHFDYRPNTREGDNQSVRSSVLVVSSWLSPGNRTFLEVASMVVNWWIVAFLCSVSRCPNGM